MRALVPVAVTLILAVTFLIVWLTHRRSAIRRSQLAALRQENERLRGLVDFISAEASLQLAAGQESHSFTADLIDDFYGKENHS